MGIKLNERFEIRPDRYCWILIEHIPTDQRKANVKRESWESPTYYASVEQCCIAAMNRVGGDCETAHELISAWRHFTDEVRELARIMQQSTQEQPGGDDEPSG